MEGYFLTGVKKAKEQGWQPRISIDNPNFHHVHPELCQLIEDPPPENPEGTGYEHLLPLPSYSPDLHQIVEHPFGGVKLGMVNEIYKAGWEVVEREGMPWLRDKVVELCERITPEQVQSGLKKLKECYQVVAAPRDSGVYINGRWVEGVEGGRPPKGFR